MLSIYRRHREKCRYAGNRVSKQCRCPLWTDGTIEGNYIRRSLKTRSFERAQQLTKQLEDGYQPQKESITIQAALDAFISDCESRNLNASTLGKYRRFAHRFVSYVVIRGISAGAARLTDITSDCLRDFRTGWALSPRTASKELERLRAFFKFSLENGWITSNPAKSIKAPKVEPSSVVPFSEKQQASILDAAYRLHNIHPKTGTFIKLLLNTGLRITDASILHKSDIQNGRLIIKATKNKATISVLLPPDLQDELDRIEGDLFPSPRGSARPETVSDYWRDEINKVFDHLAIKGHPHQFRHSLVMNMLHAGSSIEDAARVIGDSPRIVAQHYWQFCVDTQTRMDDQIKKTWKKVKPGLHVVKAGR